MTIARPRRLRSALAAATALALTALVAPGTAAPAGAGAPSEVVTGDEPIDYVALGDSYSAGPLIPAQRADPLGCLRSTNNYPAYLAGYFGVRTYRDVTCSGAETDDLDRRRQTTILPGPKPAPQLNALSDETDLVTVGIGGNDYTLFGSMIEVCETVADLAPRGAPCRRHFTNAKGVDTKMRDATRIQKSVGRVLRAVARRAPGAEVYVVGYPRLLPERGTCKAVKFAAGDYRWGDRVERRLNRSLRLAAANNGATYVNLYPASRGHDACAGSEAWINGSTLKPVRAANFHPFRRGMRAAAQEIYRQLTGGGTAPGHAFAQPPVGSGARQAG
ncbi:SGNH/GDSL hydrolase family protein [Nocardioides sp. cx-169]|uniref:SGNH/GDSL hydrolase family protein n=1 Tax=Nocardioides sp. cx-169 TaxID=2899080 RepID=UPI001E5ACA8D|nr:SGNH/GDSL hydrolase family protein [Nocardioides sp. cx-169]MCD4535417.1 SGNH/GDSL hydrolase family protein [Nocardioides sp. cx-169]